MAVIKAIIAAIELEEHTSSDSVEESQKMQEELVSKLRTSQHRILASLSVAPPIGEG